MEDLVIIDKIKKAIKNSNKLISIAYEVKKADGKLAWFSSSGKVIPENGKLAIYGSTIDITEKKQSDLSLQYLATHDSLTGVFNRRQFELVFKEKDLVSVEDSMCSIN